jgi:hypothetical protein
MSHDSLQKVFVVRLNFLLSGLPNFRKAKGRLIFSPLEKRWRQITKTLICKKQKQKKTTEINIIKKSPSIKKGKQTEATTQQSSS